MVRGCAKLTGSIVDVLKELTSVTTVDLTGCSLVKGDLRDVENKLEKLKVLHLSGTQVACDDFEKFMLGDGGKQAPKMELVDVDLSNCEQVKGMATGAFLALVSIMHYAPGSAINLKGCGGFQLILDEEENGKAYDYKMKNGHRVFGDDVTPLMKARIEAMDVKKEVTTNTTANQMDEVKRLRAQNQADASSTDGAAPMPASDEQVSDLEGGGQSQGKQEEKEEEEEEVEEEEQDKEETNSQAGDDVGTGDNAKNATPVKYFDYRVNKETPSGYFGRGEPITTTTVSKLNKIDLSGIGECLLSLGMGWDRRRSSSG